MEVPNPPQNDVKPAGFRRAAEDRTTGELCFDGWKLRRDTGELWKSGTKIRLQEQPLRILAELLARPGELVTRQQLIARLWPKGIVDFDTSLNTAVRKLRAALGDDPDNPRYIETVPRKGYRFVGQLTEQPPPSPEPRASGAGVAVDGRRARTLKASPRALAFAVGLLMLLGAATLFLLDFPSSDGTVAATNEAAESGGGPQGAPASSIAVMPFVNLSSDPEQEYFADGLSEELTNQLAKIDELFVTARTSSFQFKGRAVDVAEIGRQLGVEHVLEGSVRKSGSRVRITAQLVETATGYHLWSETYDRELGEILALQDEVSRAVAAQLEATLGGGDVDRPPGGTQDIEAYDHYLLALAAWQRGNIDLAERHEAIREYEKALEADPNFGLAQIGLAEALSITSASMVLPPAVAEDRHRAIERAVAIAPALPATSWLVAQEHFEKRAWAAADRALREMMARASDNDGESNARFGDFLLQVGRAREAVPYLERARRLDPLAALHSTNLAIAHDALGEYQRAIQLHHSAERLPGYGVFSIMPYFWTELATGDLQAARRVLPWDPDPAAAASFPPEERLSALLAISSIQSLSDAERGLAMLRGAYADPSLQIRGATFSLFAAHFGDEALSAGALREGLRWDARSGLKLAWIPLMQRVRRHPDFKALMRELGLVEYWRQAGWPEHCRALGADDFECG